MQSLKQEVSASGVVPGQSDSAVSREFLEQELREGSTAQLVELIGWRVCNGLGRTRADHDEICQELRSDLARRATSYSPQRGPWIAFARLVLTHRASELFRQYLHARHERLGTDLLGRYALEPFGLDCALPGDMAYDASLRIDQQIDVRETVKDLPPPLPELCRLLQMNHSVAEASRILNVPRSTIRGWMQRIRRRFEDRNLDQFL